MDRLNKALEIIEKERIKLQNEIEKIPMSEDFQPSDHVPASTDDFEEYDLLRGQLRMIKFFNKTAKKLTSKITEKDRTGYIFKQIEEFKKDAAEMIKNRFNKSELEFCDDMKFLEKGVEMLDDANYPEADWVQSLIDNIYGLNQALHIILGDYDKQILEEKNKKKQKE